MPIGSSEGYQYKNETQYMLGNGVPITPEAANSGSETLNRMPTAAPTEPVQTFKSETGTEVAGTSAEKQNGLNM